MASMRLHDLAAKVVGRERVPDPDDYVLVRVMLFFASIAFILAFYTLRGY